MKVKEAIDKIENGKYYSIWQAEDEVLSDYVSIVDNRDIDTHRWFALSTSVYKLEDGYVGVRGVSDIKSEYMSDIDCDVLTTACEYEEYPTISYRPKN